MADVGEGHQSTVRPEVSARIQKKRLMGDHRLITKKEPLDFIDVIYDPEWTHPKSEGKKGLLWRFVYRGNDDSKYRNGFYICEVLLHPEYPNRAGDIRVLTPNGRFETNQFICMDNTAFHQHDPKAGMKHGWNVRTIILGFISIWLDDNEKGIGHIHESVRRCKDYADNSVEYNSNVHPDIFAKFTKFYDEYKNRMTEPCREACKIEFDKIHGEASA